MSYFKDNIEKMAAYVPGEQPGDGADVIKLNTNENAYGPSPKAQEILGRFDAAALRRYPDPMAGRFRSIAGEILGVPADWILPGNGSDDLLMMLSRACLGPGRKAVILTPSFEFYFTQAHIEGSEIVEVPLDENFSLPTEPVIQAAGDLTFVASPNSPTGIATANESLKTLAENLKGVLVIDEAYVDFAEEDAMSLVREYDNVIVLRTLSKGYSLAGLRFGFGVAQPALLTGLLKTKAIYNVDAVSAAVAETASTL